MFHRSFACVVKRASQAAGARATAAHLLEGAVHDWPPLGVPPHLPEQKRRYLTLQKCNTYPVSMEPTCLIVCVMGSCVHASHFTFSPLSTHRHSKTKFKTRFKKSIAAESRRNRSQQPAAHQPWTGVHPPLQARFHLSQCRGDIPVARAQETPLAVAVEVRFGFLGWLAARGRNSLCKHLFELAGKLIK
jgi:hypothetical protein